MLKALEVGTKVPIHRHENTDETMVGLHGRLNIIIHAELPNMDDGGPGREFQETFRTVLCHAKGEYGVQIPKGVWYTIEMNEPSTIYETKDGNYMS